MQEEITARFTENEDDTVTATFELGDKGSFTIVLQDLTWGLLEDMEKIRQKSDSNPSPSDLLEFFKSYVVGGPRAIPFKHTRLVFDAISGYMSQVSSDMAKN